MNSRKSKIENRKSARGTTLYEVVIVVLIMGITSAVVLPRFAGSLGNRRAEAAAKTLAADLNGARRQARMTGQSTSIAFSLPNNNYTITGVTNLDRHASTTRVVSLINGTLKATLSAVKMANGGATVSFSGYGVASTGGTITITSGTNTKQVRIDAATGLATVL